MVTSPPKGVDPSNGFRRRMVRSLLNGGDTLLLTLLLLPHVSNAHVHTRETAALSSGYRTAVWARMCLLVHIRITGAGPAVRCRLVRLRAALGARLRGSECRTVDRSRSSSQLLVAFLASFLWMIFFAHSWSASVPSCLFGSLVIPSPLSHLTSTFQELHRYFCSRTHPDIFALPAGHLFCTASGEAEVVRTCKIAYVRWPMTVPQPKASVAVQRFLH